MRALRVVLLMLLALATQAGASELQQKLAAGDHVLLMRHADAPGVGDPPGYSLADCATQRNLGAEGRAQAGRIGAWLRQQGVAGARVFSSPWCRCKDTAALLGLGPVTEESALGSFFGEPQQAEASTVRLRAFVARTLAARKGAPLILVTHNVNIAAYVGASLGSGDMVLARVDKSGRVVSHQRYPSPN